MRIKKLKRGFAKLTKEKARIIAHLMGDGAIYINRHNYTIKYEVKDKDMIESFCKDLENIYGHKLGWAMNPSGKTGKLIPFVYLYSKLAYEDIMRYGSYKSINWEIGKEILSSNKNIKREFLRAFFDDEGSVVPQGKKAIIKLYSINLKGLKQIQTILNEFRIDTFIQSGFGLKRNVFGLIIKDINLFYKSIGFNSVRKNSKLLSIILKL